MPKMTYNKSARNEARRCSKQYKKPDEQHPENKEKAARCPAARCANNSPRLPAKTSTQLLSCHMFLVCLPLSTLGYDNVKQGNRLNRSHHTHVGCNRTGTIIRYCIPVYQGHNKGILCLTRLLASQDRAVLYNTIQQ